jgi:hypothetical protein
MSKNTDLGNLVNGLFVNSSGNVGVKNTNPTVALDVTGAGKFSAAITSGDLITSSYGTARIQITSTTNNVNAGLRYSAKDSAGTAKNAGIYYVAGTTTANTFLSLAADDNNYQFNVLANGNVGIGTSSPNLTATNRTTLDINGTNESLIGFSNGGSFKGYIFNNGTDMDYTSINATSFGAGTNFLFKTAGTERMRITSGGNVGIGTSSPNNRLQIGSMVAYTGSGYTFAMGNGTTDFLITVNAAQTGSSVTFYSSTDYYFNRSGPSSTGIINAFGFNNVSDYRLKYDLESFDGLNLVSQIKTYKYKMEETHETQYGVLAHEIQEILPHLVVGVKDGDRMQSVDYQKIVPMLIKSLQELKAEIEILKQK